MAPILPRLPGVDPARRGGTSTEAELYWRGADRVDEHVNPERRTTPLASPCCTTLRTNDLKAASATVRVDERTTISSSTPRTVAAG
jgi:hypothetical protein